MLYAALIAVSTFIVIIDQYTKYLTVTRMDMHQTIPVIPWLFQIYRATPNTGMGWSLLEGGRWFFVAITFIALALIIIAVKKKWINHPTGLWALSFIAGGAVGNLIDRICTGAVVDMIEVTFIEFPIFNVADCFVVCGAILLIIYTLFFDKPQKEVPNDSAN